MRESDEKTRWKFMPENAYPTFDFYDINGALILMGDKLQYRRRVKPQYKWDRKTCKREEIPGYQTDVTVEVVGMSCYLRRSNYSFRPQVLKYVEVIDENRSKFRIYRTDRVFNLSGEMRQVADDVSKASNAIQPLFSDAVESIVFSDERGNDSAFELGL